MDYDKEIEKYEQELEKIRRMHDQYIGVISYLKQQKEETSKENKKDK